jgi:cytidylate kinase
MAGMYRIITVEREFGSGGGEIAREISSRLGWKLWDQALTEEIANMARVDCATVERCAERVDTTFQRLFKIFMRGSHERSMPATGSEPFDADSFVAIGRNVMEKVAAEGNCVIVGRGASYLLKEHADAFHVFLYAPHVEKLRRLRGLGKNGVEAEALLNTVDRDRMTFVKHYFGADWPTRYLYHMMINTAVGNENVISSILHTMRSLEKRAASQATPSSGEAIVR